MGLIFRTKGSKEKINVHYVHAPTRYIVEEKFDGYYHGHDDMTLAQALQAQCMQESFYQSVQRNARTIKASSSTNPILNNVQGQGRASGNSSGKGRVDSQLAADEALARELQELENAFVSLEDHPGTEIDVAPVRSLMSIGGGNSSSSNTPRQVVEEDSIDPDHMTYEELQTLGEAIGTQSRGLSDELIACLPSSRYKTGFFSRKEREECVICCMAYKIRDKLMTLPCQHRYHAGCVSRWLKINKACPVCNVQVFGCSS